MAIYIFNLLIAALLTFVTARSKSSDGVLFYACFLILLNVFIGIAGIYWTLFVH